MSSSSKWKAAVSTWDFHAAGRGGVVNLPSQNCCSLSRVYSNSSMSVTAGEFRCTLSQKHPETGSDIRNALRRFNGEVKVQLSGGVAGCQ